MNDIFLVDVDDVLINTPKLKPVLREYAGADEDIQNPELLRQIEKDRPGYLKSLVYEHGREFLERYKGRCYLVSSAKSSKSDEPATDTQLAFQVLKLELCGLTALVGGEEFTRVTRDEKSEPLGEFAGKNALFIDNEIRHLEVADKLGIDTAHLLRKHLYEGSPESFPQYFREAKYAAGSLKELMEKLETHTQE